VCVCLPKLPGRLPKLLDTHVDLLAKDAGANASCRASNATLSWRRTSRQRLFPWLPRPRYPSTSWAVAYGFFCIGVAPFADLTQEHGYLDQCQKQYIRLLQGLYPTLI